jgi:ABC-type Fe3+/spermidine/putrescine transport system ATPase subunit
MEVEIRRYQKELNIPFLYVTHNQEEALTMSDRIAVMRNGRFEQIGAKTEIYTHPASAFVATFVGHANRISGGICDIENGFARIDWGGGSVLAPKPAQSERGSSVSYFVKHEDMEIHGAGLNGMKPAGVNQLSGVLRDIIFKGQTANYIVALPTGDDLVVSGTPRVAAARPNDAVVVSWPITAGACFPRDDA